MKAVSVGWVTIGLWPQRTEAGRKEVLCQVSGEQWYRWKGGCPRKNPLGEVN